MPKTVIVDITKHEDLYGRWVKRSDGFIKAAFRFFRKFSVVRNGVRNALDVGGKQVAGPPRSHDIHRPIECRAIQVGLRIFFSSGGNSRRTSRRKTV